MEKVAVLAEPIMCIDMRYHVPCRQHNGIVFPGTGTGASDRHNIQWRAQVVATV